jgi:hypothetical protein
MNKILFLIVILYGSSFSQVYDKRYTHDSENGFMWQDFEKRMIAKNVKHDFLSSMLENQRFKNISGNYKDKLSCEDDIKYLQSKVSDSIDLNRIIEMIDLFYSSKDNLIIPIRYSYCHCIKELAGFQSEELEFYRQKLLDFSNSDLE